MSSHTLEGKKKTQNGVKRLMFTVLSILLEVVFLVGIFKGLNEYAVVIDNMTRIFAVILVLKIYGRNETSSMKTPWIILILTLPILGVALYFLIGLNGGTWKMRMRYKKIDEKLLPLLAENKEVLQCLNASDPKAGNVSNYIERNACYPVYQNTDVIYFDEAVKGLEAQLAKRSDNVFELKVGTLYPLLHSMVQSGYLESYNQEANGKLRKYYRITPNGKKYLEKMIEEWNAYANAVTSMIQYSV